MVRLLPMHPLSHDRLGPETPCCDWRMSTTCARLLPARQLGCSAPGRVGS